MRKISLIIPAKNEIESLDKVISEIKKYKFINEIIIIVDSKSDNSLTIKNKNYCKFIIQSKNGYGAAIKKGFKHSSNKFAAIFNADYSFNPKDLVKMNKLSNTNEFIFGSRYTKQKKSEDDDIITYIGNIIFTFLCKKILKIKLTDILYTFVLCDVQKFNELKIKANDFKLCIELPIKIHNLGLSYCEVACIERKRYAGKKKVNVFKDGFLILMEILRSIRIKLLIYK
jgi:glycosyltransferase involved in cell wall biosynthesis